MSDTQGSHTYTGLYKEDKSVRLTNVAFTCTYDGPGSSVVDHFLVTVVGTGGGLELDNLVLRETKVHSLCARQVEGHLG